MPRGRWAVLVNLVRKPGISFSMYGSAWIGTDTGIAPLVVHLAIQWTVPRERIHYRFKHCSCNCGYTLEADCYCVIAEGGASMLVSI